MPLTRKPTVAALLGAAIAAGAIAAIPLTATGGPGLPPGAVLPDLRSDPPESVQAPYSSGGRLLLRFNGFVTNVGPGPLHVEGNPQPGAANPFRQYAFIPSTPGQEVNVEDQGPDQAPALWTPVTTPEVKFETNDGHFHWHYMKISRYSLWNEAKTAVVAPAQKVGFCLYDSMPAPGVAFRDPFGGRSYNGGAPTGSTTGPFFCDQDLGDGDTLAEGDGDGRGIESDFIRMGISPNYRDVYDWTLGLQWVDITSTAPGRYYLAAEADPENRVVETNDNNGIAYMADPVVVPGYTARPVGPIATGYQQAIGVQLKADAFVNDQEGPLGTRFFRVTKAPSHGSINVPVGATFTASNLIYTPKTGYSGVDSFEYEARDATSPYPDTPPRATVTFNVGGNPAVAVTISGAPTALIAGTSAQLRATVVNGPQSVIWTVNGVPGGNATVGTISASGLYRAPATVPPGGRIVVRAVATANRSKLAGKAINIIPARPPRPSYARGGTMAVPSAVVAPGLARVRTLAKKSGRFRVVYKYGSRTFATRSRTVAAGRNWISTARFSKRWNRKRVRMIVTFRPADGGRAMTRVIGPTALTKVRVSRSGTRIVARTKTLRNGQITMLIRHKGTVLRRCSLGRLAGTRATCAARLRSGMKASNVVATVRLLSEDGMVVIKRGRL